MNVLAINFPASLSSVLESSSTRHISMSDAIPRQFLGEKSITEDNIYVSLTYDPLDAALQIARVKSPKAGAVVLFAGEYSPSLDQKNFSNGLLRTPEHLLFMFTFPQTEKDPASSIIFAHHILSSQAVPGTPSHPKPSLT